MFKVPCIAPAISDFKNFHTQFSHAKPGRDVKSGNISLGRTEYQMCEISFHYTNSFPK